MKILLVGDLHARADKPEKRTDDNFMETVLNKLGQILDIATKHDCINILQAGDWHNSYSPDKLLIAKELDLLHDFYGNITIIHGQHDLRYHNQSSANNSALRILETTGNFQAIEGKRCLGDCINIYATPYGKKPMTEPEEGKFNILMSHVMVQDKPLYINQDFISPAEYMSEYPGFDLYFVGDIHTPFVSKRKGSLMINAGSVLRQSIDQKDYKPKVVLFDTDTREYEDIYLDVKPDVFDLSQISVKKENKFTGMIDKLKETGQISVDFKSNLDLHCKRNKISKKVVSIIEESYYNKVKG